MTSTIYNWDNRIINFATCVNSAVGMLFKSPSLLETQHKQLWRNKMMSKTFSHFVSLCHNLVVLANIANIFIIIFVMVNP